MDESGGFRRAPLERARALAEKKKIIDKRAARGEKKADAAKKAEEKKNAKPKNEKLPAERALNPSFFSFSPGPVGGSRIERAHLLFLRKIIS